MQVEFRRIDDRRWRIVADINCCGDRRLQGFLGSKRASAQSKFRRPKRRVDKVVEV